MNVIIIYYGAVVFGGIETLMARCGRYLVNAGHSVTCLIANAEPIADLVSDLHVVALGDRFKRLINPQVLRRTLMENGIDDVNMVLALDQGSALIAPLIAKLHERSGCVAVASNWVPEYFWMQNRSPWHPMSHILNWNLRLNYCPETILFMTQQYIEQGRKIFGNEWNATLFPIPIDFARFSGVKRSPVYGRIVSIGRVAKMKEYNLYMIDVMKYLLEKGCDVTWDVYGTGSLEQEMRECIERAGLTDKIRMHGHLAYEACTNVLAGAMMFVGMGTALLEAAAAGVPNVVALAYDTSGRTHGSLERHAFGNVGDFEPGQPLVSVASELERLLNLSREDYDVESERVKASASRYDEDAIMMRLCNIKTHVTPRRLSFYCYAGTLLMYDVLRRFCADAKYICKSVVSKVRGMAQ